MKLFMTEAKIGELLRASKPFPREHALFHVALATGFRAGDLISLTRRHVEQPNGEIAHRIIKTMQKTGRSVERTLPEECRRAIRRYLDSREDLNPFLFCSHSNNSRLRATPLNRSSLHRIFKLFLGLLYAGTSTDLRGNACHVTRRSVAKLISDRAGRVEPATRFLGHTSIANTVAYLDMDQFGKQADEIVQTMPWNQKG